ncbi:hypothetical protein CSB20_10965 [bacterium DOLZORAL124_64_63]|nr:MAG: hypothetical protein CSB20_10965 [bacterium DOLZORAL124_64_63]
MPPVFFLIFVVLMIMAGVYAWHQERKRREELHRWAFRYGWKMLGHSRDDWASRYPGLALFGRGGGQVGDNIITGHFRGRAVTVLDYKYVTGSGNSRTTHHFGVVLMETGFPVVPLEIRREHVFDKVGEFLGGGDIDFESAEFSRTFHVASSDRKWAYDVIHARTMEYLLGAPPFCIEFGFGEVAVYKMGRSRTADFEAQVEMAAKLIDLVPDFVVRQMKGES